MQIAESSYPQATPQLPLSHQETPPPAPPPPFGLTQPLSPVLEPASEQMQFSPFLGQYQEMQLQPPPPPAPQPPGAAQAPLQFSYQTCELPGPASPEPDYPSPCQYPLDSTPQGGMAEPDCPRSPGLQEDPATYDPLALSEFPGLFDCEMLEAVDPQHSGYVLVN